MNDFCENGKFGVVDLVEEVEEEDMEGGVDIDVMFCWLNIVVEKFGKGVFNVEVIV